MADKNRPLAPVNKIIPFSNVDGPGNRSAIFLQGCGFTCGYCHNPETQNICENCGSCVAACPAGALLLQNGRVCWQPQVCTACDACLAACPRKASPKVRLLSPQDVIDELEEALPYIAGITTSGGECTLHEEFLCALFAEVQKRGKTAFVDTNGQRLFSEMPELTRIMDAAMLDVKSADEKEHRALTGKSADTVLQNLSFLAETEKLYEVRTVVAPTRLDAAATVKKVAGLLAPYPKVRYKLIRFRPWGVKGEWEGTPSPDEAFMQQLALLAKENGAGNVVVV